MYLNEIAFTLQNQRLSSKQSVFSGRHYRHSISISDACVSFNLDDRYTWFRSQVAWDDSTPPFHKSADFATLADGRAAAVHVVSGHSPQDIYVDFPGVKKLELRLYSNHAAERAFWLDPQIGVEGEEYLSKSVSVEALATAYVIPETDCLHRTRISVPLMADRCIATVVSPGYSHLLDEMLGSLFANAYV